MSQVLRHCFFLDVLLWNTISTWGGSPPLVLCLPGLFNREVPSSLAPPSSWKPGSVQGCSTPSPSLFHLSCPSRCVLVCLEDRLGKLLCGLPLAWAPIGCTYRSIDSAPFRAKARLLISRVFLHRNYFSSSPGGLLGCCEGTSVYTTGQHLLHKHWPVKWLSSNAKQKTGHWWKEWIFPLGMHTCGGSAGFLESLFLGL